MNSTKIIGGSILMLLAFIPISLFIWGPTIFSKILQMLMGLISALYGFAIWKKRRQRIKNLQEARDALLEWRYEKRS
jgi:uncharacterized protein YacL